MAEELTKAQLYTEAQALEIEGRSTMDKEELAAAIEAARDSDPLVADELDDFEDAQEELNASNDVEEEPNPDPEPEEEPKEPAPAPRGRALRRVRPAPAVSGEAVIQGGLTYMTDRAQ